MPTSARLTAPLVTDAGRRGRRPLRNPIRKHSVGADGPVAVPKIFALPYGERLKF